MGQSKKGSTKLVTDDPEFVRLLPGYLDYMENRRPITGVREPLFHGTGSYALKKILKEGFVPRSDDDRLSGESAVNPWVPESGEEFVSFAVGDDRGETVARMYGFASCRNLGLSYNSDSFFKASRLDRVIKGMFGSLDASVDGEVRRLKDTGVLEGDDEEVRSAIRLEFELSLERNLLPGSHIFDPNFAQEQIEKLGQLLAGGNMDFDCAERVLRRNNVLFREPASEMKRQLKNLDDPESWISKRLGKLKDDWEMKRRMYEGLSAVERAELENQFPCCILVEGEGLKLKANVSSLGEERQVYDKVSPSCIREIRVPEAEVARVERWVSDAGLKGVIVTPLEYFEMRDVIAEDSEGSGNRKFTLPGDTGRKGFNTLS